MIDGTDCELPSPKSHWNVELRLGLSITVAANVVGFSAGLAPVHGAYVGAASWMRGQSPQSMSRLKLCQG
ncbi:MAG: hypothetical protein ACK54L_06735, partial [Betaproteobacteria bacterium]